MQKVSSILLGNEHLHGMLGCMPTTAAVGSTLSLRERRVYTGSQVVQLRQRELREVYAHLVATRQSVLLSVEQLDVCVHSFLQK